MADTSICVAPISGTVRCGERAATVVKVVVPGGMLKGGACVKHLEFVKDIVRSAAKVRIAAARAAAQAAAESPDNAS